MFVQRMPTSTAKNISNKDMFNVRKYALPTFWGTSCVNFQNIHSKTRLYLYHLVIYAFAFVNINFLMSLGFCFYDLFGQNLCHGCI